MSGLFGKWPRRRGLPLVASLALAFAACPGGGGLPEAVVAATIPESSLTADFPRRDRLPQSDVPEFEWYAPGRFGSWGPRPATYPAVTPPAGVDPLTWKRQRIAVVAERYLGLPYRHHHILAWNPPGVGPGVDCSNFTAWVYNYGLGIRFSSDIARQSDGAQAPGRRLGPGEPLEVGDLLFITKKDRSRVSHVVIWLGEGKIIDAHHGSVTIRDFSGWYTDCFDHARRVLE